MPTEAEELEAFALSTHTYGRLTGVSLGVHAVPDAFMMLHTGVGCKYKGAGQYCLHDLGRPSHHREGYTEVTDAALIKGSVERIGIYARSWYKKRKPAFMAVGSSTFLAMTGEDFAGAARQAEKTVPCPVAYIPTSGFDGDLYDGYGDLTCEVLARVPFRKEKPVKGRVAIAGYVFDRYEMDHAGNLQQLRFLLGALGLELGPVLLSGRPYGELMKAASCQMLLALPYSRPYAKRLKKLSGRPVTETGLPVGLGGTFAWLRRVGKAFKVGKDAVEGCVKSQARYAQPQIDTFRSYAGPRMGGRGIAVFADTPLAAGLCSLAVELGLRPSLVGLRDRSLGGKKAFIEAVRETGTELPSGLELLECPSMDRVRKRVAAHRARLGMVLGTHTELSCLRGGNGAPADASLPFVEIGFPSFTHHVLFPTPFYGVAGALALAQRMMNAIR